MKLLKPGKMEKVYIGKCHDCHAIYECDGSEVSEYDVSCKKIPPEIKCPSCYRRGRIVHFRVYEDCPSGSKLRKEVEDVNNGI